jgi:hypothetical protein
VERRCNGGGGLGAEIYEIKTEGVLHRIFIGQHRRQMARASTLTSMSTLLMMSFTL